MSVIHLEKSVLTFHLKEILEDGHENHPLTWLGLSLLVLGPKLLKVFSNSSQVRATTAMSQHPAIAHNQPLRLSEWVAAAQRRELEARMYAVIEAYPDHRTATGQAAPSSPSY